MTYLCRMAKILLIETATEVCSTAMIADGQLCALQEVMQATSHVSLLTLQIERCVQESGIALADLDAVAVSQGPGAYTALRVGTAVAKGICYALDKPLIAINTLEALANASLTGQEAALALPMIDARRQEVWTAAYDTRMRLCAPAQSLIFEHNSFDFFLEKIDPNGVFSEIIVSGNGSKKLESGSFNNKAVTYSKIIQCSAAYLKPLAEKYWANKIFADTAYFEPFYMKPPNITIEKAKI
jgi:tRNA threonylcarbamoyladenosine biosynthesis protein TsaB